MWPLNSFEELLSFFVDIPRIKIILSIMVEFANLTCKAIEGEVVA